MVLLNFYVSTVNLPYRVFIHRKNYLHWALTFYNAVMKLLLLFSTCNANEGK